jgi:hypothetical protein
MQLIQPQDEAILMGTTQIIWSPEIMPDTIRITTIDISNDGGINWEQILNSTSDDTTYSWDTSIYPDGTRYMVRIASLGYSDIGIAQSQGTFTVNNPGNAAPEVQIWAPLPGDIIAGEVEINWLAKDADADALTLNIEISLDGANWQTMADDEKNDGQFTWETNLLANSSYYHLKLKCTDGIEWVEVITSPLSIQNQTEVIPGSHLNHVSGSGDGLITARIVNVDSLTGHEYRITFDDTTSEMTTYNVKNLVTGLPVVENATELNGQTEGPLFEGLRLLIFNYEETLVDLTLTGWKNGASTLGSEISNGPGTIKGIPYAADYEISIFDNIIDTSSAFIGTAEIPINFTVTNITEDHRVDVVFIEQDGDQSISVNDQLFIVDVGEDGDPFLTWLIRFTGSDSSVTPVAGDAFLLKTLKPFSVKDVFEFTATTLVISQSDLNRFPSEFKLSQNYPNPFNPKTIINYKLPITNNVNLSIYNLLGQEVATLISENQNAGYHQVEWDANGFASGLYFYILRAGEYRDVKKMLLIK